MSISGGELDAIPVPSSLVSIETDERCQSLKTQEGDQTMPHLSADNHLRSWAKSVVWRVIGIFILGGLSWLFTKNLEQTTLITIAFHTIRLVLYYYHERVWERVRWGREMVKDDYQI